MRLPIAGLMMVAALASATAHAKGPPEWKVQANAYKVKTAQSVNSIALGAVNVDVGVHLDRLTLLSGEGHTGKKVFSGLMAATASLAGVEGDFASREPLEEHLTPEEAGKIAADVAKLVSDGVEQMQGVKVFAGEEVTSAAFYAGLPGLIDLDTNKKKVQDGRWSPEYHFGYYSTPAGSYKYHKTSAYSFSDKDFSPVIRQNLSTDAVMQVNLFLTNARGEFRIQDMLVSLSGRQWEGQKSDMVGLSFVLENPNGVSVPMEKDSKDTYAAWLALKPQFEAKLDEVIAQIQAALPASAAPAAASGTAAPASN